MLVVSDTGNCSVRLFFADLKKGFELTDHNVFLCKLGSFNLHPCLIRWVAAFREGRSRFVCTGDLRSKTYLVLLGTKLGPVLFSVLVNDLVTSWPNRAKYVDDLTLLEIVRRNSPSLLNFIVDEVQYFTGNNNMQFNPAKCRTMTIDFLGYNSCVCGVPSVT